jgi:hypothetical protein
MANYRQPVFVMLLSPIDRSKINDISGQRFGLLTVVEPAGARHYRRGMAVYFRCRCDCGGEVLAQRSNLRRYTKSCGCESTSRATVGRAGVGHPLYGVWKKMVKRCLSTTCPDFKNYGGRGIRICDRWLTGEGDGGGLDCFAADMGPRPYAEASLERRENSKGYEPNNCTWATRTEQGRNKRNNHLVTLRGETMPLSAWCERLKLPYFTIARRLRLGWPDDRALTEQIHNRGQSRR